MSRSCSPSPTTLVFSVIDSSDTPPTSIVMGGHDDAMEWTEDCEKYFLEILAERIKRDSNGLPNFKLTDWIEMDDEIYVAFAIRYGPDKLKGKYHRLRIRYTKFTELINYSDVKWDAASGKVVADDTVWDNLFQRDKIFKTFRKKGCKLYPILTEVFSNSIVPGSIPYVSIHAPQTSEEQHRSEARVVEDAESGSKKRKSEGDMPGMRRMKTSYGSDKYEAFLDAWKDSMKTFLDAWSKTMEEDYSIDECMAVLEATPDVSTTSYNKALTYFLDLDWRKIFLLMPAHRRKGWLDHLQK